VTSHREVALAFLERFCSGDVEGLAPLLMTDFRFQGPLLECETAAAYLDALRRDPPQPGCAYRLVDLAAAGDTVTLAWEYCKPAGAMLVNQRLRFRDGRISEMQLTFDAYLR